MTNATSSTVTRVTLRTDPGLTQLPVRIGELKVGTGACLLFTVGLGSCVAIVLYDAGTRIGGLAHAMLPEPANGRTDVAAGRYVNSAVPELITAMTVAGARRDRLRARLVGGASMFRDVLEGDGLRLGRRNVEAAYAALGHAGIPLDGQEVFGTFGRSVFLRTTDGELLVTSVNQPDVNL